MRSPREIARLVRHSLNRGRQFVADLATYLQRRPTPISPRALQTNDYIVATKNGLYLATGSSYLQLLPGQYYGITFSDDLIYCYQSFQHIEKGRIIAISRSTGTISSCITGLSHGCHQIDCHKSKLYITDTYHNRILEYHPAPWKLGNAHFPLGRLERGRESENYAHINSLLFRNESLFVLCHNETKKTSRPSSILECDLDFRVRNIVETPCANAHNIVFLDDATFLVCDSMNDRVFSNNDSISVNGLEHFTRGLSVTDDEIVVGESDYGERHERANLPGWLVFYDRRFKFKNRLQLPGMVQEIRALHRRDYSLSASGVLGACQ